jgi:hypothetical protein
VMNMLVSGTSLQNWSWKTLDCSATRLLRQQQIHKTVDQYINSSLPGLTTYTPPIGSSSYECPSGATNQSGTCKYADGSSAGPPVLIDTRNNKGSLTCDAYGTGYVVAGNQCVTNNDIPIVAGPALRPGELTEDQRSRFTYECYDFGIQESCAKLNAAVGVTSANAVAGVRKWDTQVANA